MEKIIEEIEKIKIEIKELNLIKNSKLVGLEEYVYVY